MILYDSNSVTKYFYNHMAKNDVLESIELGETDENIFPVIKFRNPNSSWVSKLSHSGDLKTTLRGKGILFEAFIKSQSSSKETIVYLGVPRRLIDALVSLTGEQYLKHTQTKNSYLYTTCTLSVLIAAAPNLPKEIQNLVKNYILQEAHFQLLDLYVNARVLTSKLISSLEKKYGPLNPEIRSLLLKISNKGVFGGTSDVIQEKLRQEVSIYAKNIRNKTLDTFVVKETRNKLMAIFSKSIDISSDIFFLFSSPETFFLSKSSKIIEKSAETIKKFGIIKDFNRTESIIKSKTRILKKNSKIIKNFKK